MRRFVTGQVLRFLLLMLTGCFVTFSLVSLSPTNPLQANVGSAALSSMSIEKKAALASYGGVDMPFWERFENWFVALLHGDMGMSLRYNVPVSEVLCSVR